MRVVFPPASISAVIAFAAVTPSPPSPRLNWFCPLSCFIVSDKYCMNVSTWLLIGCVLNSFTESVSSTGIKSCVQSAILLVSMFFLTNSLVRLDMRAFTSMYPAYRHIALHVSA